MPSGRVHYVPDSGANAAYRTTAWSSWSMVMNVMRATAGDDDAAGALAGTVEGWRPSAIMVERYYR